jgi:hypothetical protein
MGFQKFGTSDDQRASVDKEDEQGLSKSAAQRLEWTKEDERDLQAESEK